MIGRMIDHDPCVDQYDEAHRIYIWQVGMKHDLSQSRWQGNAAKSEETLQVGRGEQLKIGRRPWVANACCSRIVGTRSC